MDSARQTAFMDLNSFGRSFGLKKFFKKSFKTIRKSNSKYLVIDVRGNGGGNVTNSTLLGVPAEKVMEADAICNGFATELLFTV